MSEGNFPPSGAFYGSRQPYYHQNGLNDLQAGQEYGKQSGLSKPGQNAGSSYSQKLDSQPEKPPEFASSGKQNLEVS